MIIDSNHSAQEVCCYAVLGNTVLLNCHVINSLLAFSQLTFSHLSHVILSKANEVLNTVPLLNVQEVVEDIAELQLHTLSYVHLHNTLPVLVFTL